MHPNYTDEYGVGRGRIETGSRQLHLDSCNGFKDIYKSLNQIKLLTLITICQNKYCIEV